MGRSEPEFRGEEPSGLLERQVAVAADERRAVLQDLARTCGSELLGPGATRIVPGEGYPYAWIVLVGEAPGEQEDLQGRPFVGRSGQLLDRLLAEAGLDRSEVWITNTVKARPVLFEGERMRNRAPRASEVKAWSGCLHEELRLIQPRVLVGLGAVAGQALIGKDFKITRQRGQWLHDLVLGTDVLVTWHPSYLLRQQGEDRDRLIAETRDDLRAVAGRLGRQGYSRARPGP